MIYRLARLVFSLIVRLGFFKLTIIGKENIPLDGGVILAANHYGPFDPPFICLLTKRSVRFMARAKGWLYNLSRRAALAFMINKGSPDRPALNVAQTLLDGGQVVAMMAIGHRQKHDHDSLPQRGSCFLAFECTRRVAVVPVGVYWTKPKGRTHVHLACGEPLYREDFGDSRQMNEALRVSILAQRHRAEQLAL